MKVSEIPSYFIKKSSTQWSDPTTNQMFFVDPTNPELLVQRLWTPDELSDYNAAKSVELSNTLVLNNVSKTSIQTLIDDIGPSKYLPDGVTPNPLLIAGATSLNAIIADTKANINANPYLYITFLAKAIKRADKALIASIKLQQQVVSDTSTGSD